MSDLPNGWSRQRLGDTLELLIDHRGQTPGKLGGEFQEHGVPVISAIHIKGGRVDFAQRERFVSREMFERWMPERLKFGDVLLTSEAPMGLVAVVPSDAPLVLSQRLFALRGRAGVLDNRYLRWALVAQPIRDQLDRRSSGTTVTGIRQRELVQVELPLPSLGEQRRIIDILEDHFAHLDSASTLIESATVRTKAAEKSSLKRLVALTPECQTLTLNQLAGGGLFCDGDWVESKDQDSTGSVRLTQLADVGIGVFRDRSDRWLRPDQAESLGCTYLVPGDLLIARMPEPIARACRVPEGLGTAVTAVDVAILRVTRSDVDPEWLMWAVNGDDFRRRAEALQSGTTRKRISRKNLATLTLLVPPRNVQAIRLRELEMSMEGLRRIRDEAAAAKKRSDALRRALLAAAFSGRLTGHTTDIEMVEEMANV